MAFCVGCGSNLALDVGACPSCGRAASAPFPAPAKPAPTGDATGGLIPYKNVPALIGYYLGVFSLIPFFPIGLGGLVCGILGLKRARANPMVKGKVHAWIGIVVGGLFGTLWLVLTAMIAIGALSH